MFIIKKEGVANLPTKSGVYAFLGKEGILYIGKASNLRERVKNHFQQPSYRDGLFLEKISKIGYIETDSEIEALILEANLIKKHQPKYNVIWKDDKNYFYVGITKEDFPRIFITHQIKTQNAKLKTQNYNLKIKSAFVGPFVEGGALKKTLRTLRRVFPYYSIKKHPKGNCPWCHLGLCPGPEANGAEYQKNVKNLIGVLKGKRKSVLKKLGREMKKTSLSQDYEKAAKIRDVILALEKTISQIKIFTEKNEGHPTAGVWKKTEKKLKKILGTNETISKIEAYDVSNIQGNLATGSMITFINGAPAKNLYRKFKVKISGSPNDIAMLKEVLGRRFKHGEWTYPDLILIDGGNAQLNIARRCLRYLTYDVKQIKAAALAKRNNELYVENQEKPILLKNLPREIFNLILQLRDEAHRFAISYHKKLRLKTLLK